jgi:hypothetical protein
MRKKPHPILDNPELGLTTTAEAGLVFSTGLPVSFTAAHNPERAPRCAGRFGQDLEPVGYYCLVAATEDAAAHARKIGWVVTRVHLDNPIVLEWIGYGPHGWKARLSEACGRRTRAALTRFLVGLGFDGIVTTRSEETAEVVLLRRN